MLIGGWSRIVLLALIALSALVGCGDDAEDQPPPRPPTATAPQKAPPERAHRPPPLDFSRVETVAEGLEVPWELVFPSKDAILVTERPGRVRLIEDGRVDPEPVLELEVVAEGEAGLLGLALDPDFPRQRFAYVYYTAEDSNRVSRFHLGKDFGFGDERTLIEGIPAGSVHDGGRIAFGPDGMLYATAGEAGQADRAPDLGTLAGKILRIEPDGDVPPDNPFGDSPIFSYGHRNPQGIDWDSRGRLYESEHGPSGELGVCCHDEINLIEAGGFYGWPFRAGRTPAGSGQPPEAPIEPIAESGSETTWAPAGLVVHEPRGGPTSLLVATLAGQELRRFILRDGDPRSVTRVEVPLSGLGRMRALALGPGDCLYATTSNTDGRGTPREGDDRIIRVCPRG